MTKKTFYELIKYSINGVCTTLVNYLIFIVMLKNETHYLLANSIAWSIAVLFAYYTNRKLVFHSNQEIKKELTSFFLLRLITLLIENTLLFIIIDLIGIPSLHAKIIVSIITILANYMTCKNKIFLKGMI